MKIRILRSGLASLALASALTFGALQASALPLIGDDTRVTLSKTALDAFAGLELSVDPFGSAFLDDYPNSAPPENPPRIAFPITGGELLPPDDPTDPFLGTVEHVGSGLDLTIGGSILSLGDFLIDFAAGILSATSVNGDPADLPLFELQDCTIVAFTSGNACEDSDGSFRLDGFGLYLTEDAAAALGAFFLDDDEALLDFAGVQIGIANIDVRFVPEPGTALLLGTGLAGLVATRRRAPRA